MALRQRHGHAPRGGEHEIAAQRAIDSKRAQRDQHQQRAHACLVEGRRGNLQTDGRLREAFDCQVRFPALGFNQSKRRRTGALCPRRAVRQADHPQKLSLADGRRQHAGHARHAQVLAHVIERAHHHQTQRIAHVGKQRHDELGGEAFIALIDDHRIGFCLARQRKGLLHVGFITDVDLAHMTGDDGADFIGGGADIKHTAGGRRQGLVGGSGLDHGHQRTLATAAARIRWWAIAAFTGNANGNSTVTRESIRNTPHQTEVRPNPRNSKEWFPPS